MLGKKTSRMNGLGAGAATDDVISAALSSIDLLPTDLKYEAFTLIEHQARMPPSEHSRCVCSRKGVIRKAGVTPDKLLAVTDSVLRDILLDEIAIATLRDSIKLNNSDLELHKMLKETNMEATRRLQMVRHAFSSWQRKTQ